MPIVYEHNVAAGPLAGTVFRAGQYSGMIAKQKRLDDQAQAEADRAQRAALQAQEMQFRAEQNAQELALKERLSQREFDFDKQKQALAFRQQKDLFALQQQDKAEQELQDEAAAQMAGLDKERRDKEALGWTYSPGLDKQRRKVQGDIQRVTRDRTIRDEQRMPILAKLHSDLAQMMPDQEPFQGLLKPDELAMLRKGALRNDFGDPVEESDKRPGTLIRSRVGMTDDAKQVENQIKAYEASVKEMQVQAAKQKQEVAQQSAQAKSDAQAYMKYLQLFQGQKDLMGEPKYSPEEAAAKAFDALQEQKAKLGQPMPASAQPIQGPDPIEEIMSRYRSGVALSPQDAQLLSQYLSNLGPAAVTAMR